MNTTTTLAGQRRHLMAAPAPGFVDAGKVRGHLRRLTSAGYRLATLAEATGCSVPALGRISRGITARVYTSTAAAILAVPIPDGAIYDGRMTDSTGTRRRVQALMRKGWTIPQIAAQAGLGRQPLDAALDGHPVSRSTRDAVRGAYDALWNLPPDETTQFGAMAASRARNRALAAGWPPPAAWDDDDIDDPDASPAESPDVDPGRGVLDLDEWAFLVRGGENPERAAARCGVTPAAVERAAHRARRADVLALLTATHLAAA